MSEVHPTSVLKPKFHVGQMVCVTVNNGTMHQIPVGTHVLVCKFENSPTLGPIVHVALEITIKGETRKAMQIVEIGDLEAIQEA